MKCGCEAEWSPVTGQGVIDREGCRMDEAVAIIESFCREFDCWDALPIKAAEAFLAKLSAEGGEG